jgi:tryptophanyl-tRNA synthetase
MIITGHLDGLDKLNESKMSKSIVSQHIIFLDDKQEQLIMCIPGCSVTGKSQLIHAITV